eukprot:TRINITY_DN47991_c0_g1_i1.p1 TRINITY_DN47991_c0_g1~~TRINITY_DN47991_c0_g1_i1.p1  ORF type:complete len:539 (+),score=118.73 TRINITY_DN47991_c0_g1_i1:148-1764(+)
MLRALGIAEDAAASATSQFVISDQSKEIAEDTKRPCGKPHWGLWVAAWGGIRLTLCGELPESLGTKKAIFEASQAQSESTQTRAFDIVLLGATGFTGRLMVEHLDFLLASPQPNIKHNVRRAKTWAVAGRNAQRLAEVVARCKTSPEVLVAMSAHELAEVAKKCHVLVAAAGPYSVCGEAALRACVAAGTHYIDISGETPWMHDMIKCYHQEAKSKGIMVVHAAAQVCAVDELNCYLLADNLGPLKQFREYFFQYGGTTGGTFTTNIGTLEGMTEDRLRVFSDPFSLGGHRNCGQQPEDPDMVAASQDKLYPSLWLQPAYNSHTGARIIRRSCQLFEEYPCGINYGAGLSVVIRDLASSKVAAEKAVAMNRPPPSVDVARAAASQMRQQVSQGIMPKPGAGPPKETRALYYSEVLAIGEAESGKWAHVHYTGPEAYEVTAMAAVTGALVLVEEESSVQPSSRGGVVTPAFAFHGSSYMQRLESVGFACAEGRRMEFKFCEGKPSEETVREAMLRKMRSAAQGQAELGKGKLRSWATPV